MSITKNYKAWAAARKEAAKERLRQDGYNYAAGQLLCNGDIIARQLYAESHDPSGKLHPFDEGILDALNAFERQRRKAEVVSAKPFVGVAPPPPVFEITTPNFTFIVPLWLTLTGSDREYLIVTDASFQDAKTECTLTGRCVKKFYAREEELLVEVVRKGIATFVNVKDVTCTAEYPAK